MAETTNKLKAEKEKVREAKEEKIVEPKPVTEKIREKKKKKTSTGWFTAIREDERLPKIIGLILLLSSIYLFVGLASYLFTW